MTTGLDLQTIKFVKIFEKDEDGNHPVANIPITSPQKIRAYVDMGDLQPKNAANNDHGWRLDPEITAKIRDVLDDPARLEQIAKETTTPLDMINAFHVLMYEISRNRQLANRAAKNSLDKEQATAEYEKAVANARNNEPEKVPASGTESNYTPKGK